jgi:hypothetical protein
MKTSPRIGLGLSAAVLSQLSGTRAPAGFQQNQDGQQ